WEFTFVEIAPVTADPTPCFAPASAYDLQTWATPGTAIHGPSRGGRIDVPTASTVETSGRRRVLVSLGAVAGSAVVGYTLRETIGEVGDAVDGPALEGGRTVLEFSQASVVWMIDKLAPVVSLLT